MPLNPQIPLSVQGLEMPNFLGMYNQALAARARRLDNRLRTRQEKYREQLGSKIGLGLEPEQAAMELQGQYPHMSQQTITDSRTMKRKQQEAEIQQQLAQRQQAAHTIATVGPLAEKWGKLPYMEKEKEWPVMSRELQRMGVNVPIGEWTPEIDRMIDMAGQQWQAGQLARGSQVPSAVREFEYYEGLPTDEKKRIFMSLKRGMPTPLKGEGEFYDRDVVTGEFEGTGLKPAGTYKKGLEFAKLGYDKQRLDNATAKIKLETAKMEQAIKDGLADKADVLRTYEDKTRDAVSTIENMLRHPGLSDAVGFKGASSFFGLKEEPVAGTDAAGFVAQFKKIGGQAFLQAFASIKGGGHITEIEGQKATEAITSMNRAQKEEEFIKSANEFKNILLKGLQRARKKYSTQTGPVKAPSTKVKPRSKQRTNVNKDF